MKRKILHIAIAALCITFGSCTKMLDENATTFIDLDKYFGPDKNGAKFNALLMGVFSNLQSAYVNANLIGSCGTDDLFNPTQGTSTNNNTTPQDRYGVTATLPAVNGCWGVYYAVIRDANLLISRSIYVNTSDITNADKNAIVAQARFLRAWAYFNLVRWFGPVPLLTEEVTDFNSALLIKGRDPIQKVYEAIIDDLTYAATDGVLPTAKSPDGTINTWAAKALLAKVYLTLATYMYSYEGAPEADNPIKANPRTWDPTVDGDYGNVPFIPMWHRIKGYDDMRNAGYSPQELLSKSFDNLAAIINSGVYQLNTLYRDCFLIESKNLNPESIWEIQFCSQPGYGSTWSKQFGIDSGAAPRGINAMAGTHSYYAVPSFFYKYRVGDQRRAWAILPLKSIGGATTFPVAFPGMSITPAEQNTNSAAIKSKVCYNVTVSNSLPVTKYRWGTLAQNPDPDQWYSVKMGFPNAYCPNNVVVLRYADVLLMYAEAGLLLNGGVATQDGIDKINIVMARARSGKTVEQLKAEYSAIYTDVRYKDSDFPQDYTTATLTYDKLLDERGREFIAEFQRWNDLVRSGRLKDRAEYRVTSPEAVALLTGKVKPENCLFPIPQMERDASQDKAALYQNPGY